MKHSIQTLVGLSVFLCSVNVLAASASAPVAGHITPVVAAKSAPAEDFKGTTPDRPTVLGALTGLGVIDATAGFVLLGTVSQEIVHHGFVPDINDQVYLEAAAGPFFSSPGNAFVWSTHLRWDFHKDSQLTPYAIGGFAGNVTGAALGNRWEFFPRFGIGAFLRASNNILLRGEVSHEFITVGLAYEL
jgi:hypothetical protein